MGGRQAVYQMLASQQHRATLTCAPGWSVVRSLPRLAQLERSTQRALLATWAHARERRREGRPLKPKSPLLRVVVGLPRAAVAEVMGMLSAVPEA